MGILEAIYIKKNNIPVAKLGINPTQSAVFEVGMSIAEAKEIIALTIPGMIYSSQFKYDQENDLYKARTRSSLFSWGERVIIRLTEFDQSKLQLSVSSKPVLKTTLVDFGKSAVNIHNIKWAFKQA